MQALTPTLFPCYAAADRETAGGIAEFLESGAGVRVLLDEGEMRPGEDLVQKAREARMADIVLVIFSRNSLPSPWPRYKWEDALQKEPAEENVRIGFAKLDDCSQPRVLAPLFDLTAMPIAMLRRLKRWVRIGKYSEPEIHYRDLAARVEELGLVLADQPGTLTVDRAALALEFARIFREDFDAIIRLQCGGRSLAALAGDLSAQLGLRLEGDLERNLAELRNFCAARRFLLWMEGASAEEARQLAPGRGSSTLITTEARAEAPPEDESLRDIQYTFAHPGLEDWAGLCRLARLGFRLAREQGRIAEGFELLQKWHELAEARADRNVLEESAREMIWILHGWDRMEEARALEFDRASKYADQMALPIPATVPPPSRLLEDAPQASEVARAPRMPRPEQFQFDFNP